MMTLLLVLLVLRTPVAFAIGISTLAYMAFATELNLMTLPQRMSAGADSFVLLAVPFFLFAGELMNAGGITQRLVRLAQALVGSLRGGLSHVVVGVNMLMAGVSGAAIADAAAVGSVMIPEMQRRGYSRGFAAAVNASAATIGPVIPPSVGFIIYGSLANVSVGKLFLAGTIPGILMGLYMMIACSIIARKRDLPRGEPINLRELASALKNASWAILMPVIILGGIVGGIITPTEAGAIAVAYGLFVGMVVYRQITIRDLPRLLARSAKQSAVILFIIACASAFGWMLTLEGAPGRLVGFFNSVSQSPWVFVLLMIIVVLALGCVMEGASIMIVLTPLLLPALAHYEVDLVQFGVTFQLAIMIGLLTPPVGMLLFVISGVGNVPMNEMLRELWPFLLVLTIILLLVAFVPPLTLWLPQWWSGPAIGG